MTNDTQRLLAALPYVLWPVAVILLIVQETKLPKQQDRLLRHHAYNALGFAIGAVLLSIPVMILSILPILGGIIVFLYWITIIILAIMSALRAYNNEQVHVPVMTGF